MTAVDVKWWGDTTDKATLSGVIPWHALKVGSGVTFCGRTVQTGAQLAGDELDGTGGALCPECLKATRKMTGERVDGSIGADCMACEGPCRFGKCKDCGGHSEHNWGCPQTTTWKPGQEWRGMVAATVKEASPNVPIKVTELQRGDLVRLDDVPHPPKYLTVLDVLDVAEGVEVRFMEGGISIYPPGGVITGVRNPGPDDNGPTE